MKALISLGEVAAVTRMVDVACSRCERRGRLSLERMVAQHGPGTPLRHSVAALNADCPSREAHQLRDRCDILFPGLAALLGYPPG